MTALLIRYDNPAAVPLDMLLSLIPSLPRHALDLLTQEMIDRLDALDGDPDLEPEDDIENDEHDGCEPDESRPEGIVLPLPQYAVDQSIGPINLVEADRFYRRRMGAI